MQLNKVAGIFMGFILLASSQLWAADYQIDTKGAHAFIQFRVKHLGYSWLYGRFNTFEGSFSYDEKKPEATKVNVTIDTASVDSNHAERDKHLRSDDFLDVKKYPKATFISKKVMPKADGKAVLVGDLTLHGVTKEVSIDVTAIGGGKDPWGGYRQGFQGSTSFKLKDFNIKKDLGPAAQEVELILSIEGIRQG
ncbi:YceI family protein [Endozoicomonas sp. SM1973]|uniref:YceI family protein n=1 Tax=Spartinivicinus marinus TaxID=2994442 RepID=A0A853IEG9_9GAMM|nr:YceI family protein [Spartinivicinus marinus]MCX4025355.1 YceI family protein [Spartinivicinus marinus]NYZ68928.1 YceI family protein [Spartinivicinus marinus]